MNEVFNIKTDAYHCSAVLLEPNLENSQERVMSTNYMGLLKWI